MKRILSLLLTLFLLLSAFCACGTREEFSDASSAGGSENEGSLSSDASEGGNPSADVSDGELRVPQRLFVTDGREVYTRLYSMYMADTDKETLKNEAENLRSFMLGAAVDSSLGGAKYTGKIYTTGDYVVTTDDELKAAVNKARSGEVIFIPSGVTIDIADLYTTEKFNVALSAGVILASDRGINEGGVLKMSHPMGVLITCATNTTVTGLNICGAVTAFSENTAAVKDIGIRINGKNVTVSNCEFAAFSDSAVLLPTVGGVDIDNCYFHHCEIGVRSGGGEISLTKNAFFANETDYKSNSESSLPESNGILAAVEPQPLTVRRVNPDITAAIFPADGYEVYELLGDVASGDTSKIISALAVHSGTTDFYEYKDKISVEKDGKIYGVTDDGTPLGGGAGYDNIFTFGDYTATDAESLIAALGKAKNGETVFIPGDVQMDLTGHTVTVPEGVTVASDRGNMLDDGSISSGAMLYTTVRQPETIILSKNSVFSGITLAGPDTERHMTHLNRGLNAEGTLYTDYYYSLPLTRGVSINGSGAEVANCEISGFSNAGVYVHAVADVKVHHCFIHHNQRNGFGYGVVIHGAAYAEIYRNLFNFDRHAIAADGSADSGYQAHDNVHMGTAIYHIFDAHGGVDRGDGTQIACERIDMYNNAFLSDKIPYKKRGTPEEYSKFTRNIIIYPETFYQYRFLYGTNFICEDNVWGIADPIIPDYSFDGGRKFTFNASGDTRFYSDMEYIDSATHSLRYAYFLVFTPAEDGYYISEYGNNLDNGSIYGWNEKVFIPEGGFVIAFTNKSAAAKQLYAAIEARHGVIYNTSVTLDGDYIATYENGKIIVTQSKD